MLQKSIFISSNKTRWYIVMCYVKQILKNKYSNWFKRQYVTVSMLQVKTSRRQFPIFEIVNINGKPNTYKAMITFES